jgi:hypothetical protein
MCSTNVHGRRAHARSVRVPCVHRARAPHVPHAHNACTARTQHAQKGGAGWERGVPRAACRGCVQGTRACAHIGRARRAHIGRGGCVWGARGEGRATYGALCEVRGYNQCATSMCPHWDGPAALPLPLPVAQTLDARDPHVRGYNPHPGGNE